MVRLGSIVAALMGLTVTYASPGVAGPVMTEGRGWLPADSVAVRYFDTPNVVVSPDGKKFFFVSDRGDLDCDCNIFTLTVYEAESVKRALQSGQRAVPRPLYSLTRRSSNHNGSAFGRAQWDTDGKAIAFEGRDDNGASQTFELNLRSGLMEALTHWPPGVRGVMRNGSLAIGEIDALAEKSPAGYPMSVMTRSALLDLMFHNRGRDTIVSYKGGEPWRLKTASASSYPAYISDDGERAVVVDVPKNVPTAWSGYDRLPIRADSGEVEATDALRFILVDGKGHFERPVFDAPIGTATKLGYEFGTRYPEQPVFPRALWAKDGTHVVLVNTSIPLSAQPSHAASTMAYIVDYNSGAGTWAIIEPLQDTTSGTMRSVAEVGWLKEGRELLVRHEIGGKAADGTLYTLVEDRWVGRSVSASVRLPGDDSQKPKLKFGLDVQLRQSANDPPMMVASAGGHELTLTEPDPALVGLRLARQEPLQWETAGKANTGGLLLPEMGKTQRVPLVIQAYEYSAKEFRPDGPETQAYAAQALVARGMAVLNVTIPALDPAIGNTPRELTDFASEVDTAADALATRGLIDRSRVGLIGFSRAGLEVYYAVTHPSKSPLAAAVVDDAFTGTFYHYLVGEIPGGYSRDFLGLYSGTFWQNKTAWLDREPSFNLDRVQTPAMFTIHNQKGWLITIDTIAAFAINHRPLEYLVFPEGGHTLEMPRERVASQEASIDWMAFWLKGETPPDAARAARWALLRKQQEVILAEGKAGGHDVTPLPPPVSAPAWAVDAWMATHKLIGNLAPDGQHVVSDGTAPH